MTTFFNDYQSFVLNEKNMQDYLKYKFAYSKNISSASTSAHVQRQSSSTPKQKPCYIPKEQDTLFWCFYIISKGEINYEMLSNKNSLTSKQLKIEYVSTIRQHKQLLKIYKFDTISNIENNLVNENNINIKTFLSLCSIENINVIYASNKTYFELLMNNSDTIYIIRETDYQNSKYAKKYGYELATPTTMQEIRDTLYKITCIDKPIKSVSSYKLTDLIEIACKLGLKDRNEHGKPKTKMELYQDIVQYF